MSGFAKEVEPWLGPLAGVADLFGTVFKLVADAARDKAIRESIVARTQYSGAAESLQARLDTARFNDPAAQREAMEYLVRVDTKAKKLVSASDIRAVFAAARQAQAGLVRKSAKPDYDGLLNAQGGRTGVGWERDKGSGGLIRPGPDRFPPDLSRARAISPAASSPARAR